MAKLWTCPKCKRRFKNKNQAHTCAAYPVQKHFAGKEEIALPLYSKLKEEIKKNIGPFKVESLPCCIHLVKTSAFAAVFALRDGIKIHFSLDRSLKSPRIEKSYQLSAHKYKYSVYINNDSEIDKELIKWLKDSYNL